MCNKVSTTTSTLTPPLKCADPFLANRGFLYPGMFHSFRTRGDYRVTLPPVPQWKINPPAGQECPAPNCALEATRRRHEWFCLSSRQLLAGPYWKQLSQHSKETRQPPAKRRACSQTWGRLLFTLLLPAASSTFLPLAVREGR